MASTLIHYNQILKPVRLLVAQHGVSLTRARRPVGKYSRIVAVEDSFDKWLHRLQVDLDYANCYHFGLMVPVYFIEGIALLFGPVQHIGDLFLLEFDVEGVQH